MLKKIFVVGAPRSGTTLTQSILAAHPLVYSTRETHLIVNMRRNGSKFKFLDHIRLDPNRVQQAIEYLRDRCPERHQQFQIQQPYCRRLSDSIRLLNQLYTAAAQARNKIYWVEKSPEHVGYIYPISRHIESPIFIHTIRDPRDNIASLYDVGQTYPKSWKNRQTLQRCIDTYQLYLSKSMPHLNREHHFFLVYDHLIENPEQQIRSLLSFTGLDDFFPDIHQIDSGNHTISGKDEFWKKEHRAGIQDTRLLKYHRLFNKKQKEQIEDQTSRIYQQIITKLTMPTFT